jgi:pyruvate/2-oxoglutarate dehydrogenase complex dihydrolipoamide dehydrogenase (E3) component
MASDSYDVLILGGGNAGFGATVPTRKAGIKVAMIEERDLGGTCPNRGGTPKKVLVAAWTTPCTRSAKPTSIASARASPSSTGGR